MTELDQIWRTGPAERAAAPRHEERPAWSDRLVEAGALFLLVFTPLAFGTVDPWAEAVAELVVLGMLLAWAVKMVQDWEVRIELPPGWLPGLLFLGLVGLQVVPLPLDWLASLSPLAAEQARQAALTAGDAPGLGTLSASPHDTRRLALKLGAVAAFFLVCYNTYRTRAQVRRALWTMVAMGALLSVFAIAQRMTWNDHFYWVGPLAPTRHAFGPFANRAHFAGLMAVIVPVALALLFAARRRGSSREQLVRTWRDRLRLWNSQEGSAAGVLPWLVLLMAGAALVSGSRGGMIALLVSVMTMVGLGLRVSSRAWRLAGVAAALALVMLAAAWIGGEVLYGTAERLAEEVEDYGESPRLRIWEDAIALWRDAPILGTGLGTFEWAFARVRTLPGSKVYTHAESDWVQLLTDTGLAGIALIMLALGLLGASLLRCRQRSSRISMQRTLALGALVAVIGAVIQAIPNFNLVVMSNLLYAALPASIVLARERAEG
ncbi:MAG: O-antigen ligase family protein [Candidatus Rokuibacteriota bacterium]